jgi:hypothetical protein
MQGQQAVAEMAQGQPTVKEQIDRALGATPYGFAGGGIVAFADGGDLGFEDLEGLGEEDAFLDKPLYDMLLDYVSGLGSGSAEAPAGPREPLVDRAIRTLGGNVPVSEPRPGAEARAQDRALRGAPTEVTTPTLPAYLDESRRRDVPPAARPAAAAQPAARPAVPVGVRTPATTQPPAARPDGLGDAFNAYRQQQEALAELMRGQGAAAPEVLEARRRYDEMMSGLLKGEEDALTEAQTAAGRSIFDDPEVMAEMLAGLSGAKTFGEALVGAGAGAARGRASRQKAVAEAKKDLNKLRRELAMKQAELQLARKEGDVNRARAAAVEVQKLKVAVEESSLDYQLKSEDAETRRIAANASMTSAQQRGSSTDETANLRRAQAMRADPQYGGIQKEFEEATRMAGIAPQSASVQARLARARAAVEALAEAYGVVTLSATSGAPATAPGAAPAGWGQPRVVKP